MEFIDLLISLAVVIWRRFPLAVIITGASIILLVLLIVLLSRRRPARDEFDLGARADQRREPDLFGGYSPYADDYRPEPRRARSREGSGKRFGFLALSLTFLFGALIGFAGLGIAKRFDIAPGVVRAVERVETKIATFYTPSEPPPVEADVPRQAPPPKAQDRIETPSVVDRSGSAKLDSFVAELRAKLPTPVDQTTDLISVEEQANVVTLGFRVSELVPNLDAQRFAASLQENIEANACQPSGNSGVRELNLDGVEFIFLYTDQADETLAEVRLPPGFCDDVG